MRERKSRKKIVLAVTAVAIATVVALWQFYAFVTFQSAAGELDLQGGRTHLWWAIGFGLIAFIAAFFFASVFLRYNSDDELHITSPPARREDARTV